MEERLSEQEIRQRGTTVRASIDVPMEQAAAFDAFVEQLE